MLHTGNSRPDIGRHSINVAHGLSGVWGCMALVANTCCIMQYILHHLESVNAIALAKPDCLYCRYFIHRLNSTRSMCQGAFIMKKNHIKSWKKKQL